MKNLPFWNIRYYVLTILAALGFFMWAEVRGKRILGDDAIAQDEAYDGSRSGVRGRSHFYHK